MERPILFSTEMVRAILEGRKTQTRRVIKPQPEKAEWNKGYFYKGAYWYLPGLEKCPYGQPGDILWVRETWAPARGAGAPGYLYKATDNLDDVKWKPSIHMPRDAARLFLKVKNIRVERLQEINDEDCFAEGVEKTEFYDRAEHYSLGGSPLQGGSVEKCAFIGLWDSINAKRGFGWDTNPWVWVVEFKRLKAVEA